MRPTGRVPLRFAIALALAGVTLIGWESCKTRAQDTPKASRAEEPKEETKTIPGPAPSELPLPSPALSDRPADGAPTAAPAPPTPIRPDLGAATADLAFPVNDDPEKNARAFVERNRKEAQDELKKLKDEAERLRTRLGKVEAGIRRWEALLGALEKSEQIEPLSTVGPAHTIVPTAENPTDLDAIPRAKAATVIRESVPAASPAPVPR